MQRVFGACISIFEFLNHYPFSYIYLFQPNLPSFFACSLIPVMTDGQAEKGKSKFTIRKEWELALINRAGGLYGRILTEVVTTDQTQ